MPPDGTIPIIANIRKIKTNKIPKISLVHQYVFCFVCLCPTICRINVMNVCNPIKCTSRLFFLCISFFASPNFIHLPWSPYSLPFALCQYSISKFRTYLSLFALHKRKDVIKKAHNGIESSQYFLLDLVKQMNKKFATRRIR